jgi:ATP-dependent helicase HrpB
VVRLASAVEPEWLVEVCPNELEDIEEHVLDRASGRVERVLRCRVGSVVLEEHRTAASPGPEVARVLLRVAASTGSLAASQRTQYQQLLARLELVRTAFPERPLPLLDEATYDQVLRQAAGQVTSLRELDQVDVMRSVLARLSAEQRRALREQAPDQLCLPSGRRVRVHYQIGKGPWIASRLQDFFGMTQSPTLCGGRVPLTLHLLAPNQRAVQVTRDLEGFWLRHYPGIRRQLMRRYSKHAWPEDGSVAQPPRPGRSTGQNRGR